MVLISLGVIMTYVQTLSQANIKTYYDKDKFLLKEDYFVNNKRDKILNGKYVRFFPNGNPELIGKYILGKKDSLFVEFYQHGATRRIVKYFKERNEDE